MDPVRPQSGRWLAWLLFALVTALSLLGIGLNLASLAGQPQPVSRIFDVAAGAMAIPFALIAALIISRQPRNLIGWQLMVPAFLIAIDPLALGYLARFPTAPAQPAGPLLLVVWFSSWSWLLLIIPLVLIPLNFPTGQPPSPRWRWVGVGMLLVGLVFILFVTFSLELQSSSEAVSWSVPNPIGFVSESTFQVFQPAWTVVLLSLVLLSFASLVVRYRRAGAVMRTQIRWLLYAGALFAVVYVLGFILPDNSVSGSQTELGFIWNLAFNLTILAFPAAIAIAVLRYRLWDIDVIIRRTLVYSILTAILALIYFGSVLLIQPLLARFVGQSTQLTTVLFTLLIAALFAPLRRAVQAAIDRRFFRRKYDAVHTLAQFAASARDETDLEQLTARLGHAVEQTVQPEHVGLWLKGR
jgi:hypothetical protein